MEDCTIVEDGLNGYDLTVSFNGRRYLAAWTHEGEPVMTATYENREWTLDVAKRPIPLRQMIMRVNDWLYNYVKNPLRMPDDEMFPIPIVGVCH